MLIPFFVYFLVYLVASGFYSSTFHPFGFITFPTWLIAAAAWLHSIQFVFVQGAVDLCRLDSAGKHYPYAVGVRHLYLTDKRLEASVYYPIDKSSEHQFTALWYENPERTMKAMKEVFGPMF